jgi:membrane protein DedA with SNARE-associated domain
VVVGLAQRRFYTIGMRGTYLSFFSNMISHIIAHWGYIAVFGMTMVEGFGVFFVPGETTLMAAAIYAGHTGRLDIIVVLLVAACGAIIGDNFAFWIGHKFGFPLLRRYGHYIRINEKRLRFVQYLFLRHGKPIVFIGRFVMLLRAWESFLAGANMMPWRKFAPVNAAAIVVWVLVWGLGSWGIGQASTGILEWLSIAILVAICIILLAGWIYFRRHETELEAKAERALPGPLRAHRPADLKSASTH